MANEVIGIETIYESKGAEKYSKLLIEIIGLLQAIDNIKLASMEDSMSKASKDTQLLKNGLLAIANVLTSIQSTSLSGLSQQLQNISTQLSSAAGGVGGGGIGSDAGAGAADNFGEGFTKQFANINWSRVIRDFQGFGSVLGGGLGGPLGMALGSTLGGALDSVINKIRSSFVDAFNLLADTGIKAFNILIEKASYFQDQMVYLDTLIARLGVEKGAFSTVGEALDSIGNKSDVLLGRIQTLALETPYAIDEVIRMFKSLTGRGVDIDRTLGTIQSLADAGAGLALPNYELTRLTQNLVQVATTGKLYERDIYEFGRAGVIVSEMLSKYLNLTIDETKVALKEGAISAEEFIDVFNRYTADKFEGAAERLTRTITGMTQKLRDLLYFLGRDIFGPLLDELSEPFTKIIDAMIEVSRSGVFQTMGEAFARMFKGINLITNESVDSIQIKIFNFLTWLVKSGNKIASYGYKMMLQWGIGLVKGAIQAITKVVSLISNLFSWFLKPQSPPRVLPDIYKWGVQTMEEWLKGFTNLDFDVLNAIQDPLESVLTQLEFEPNQITDALQNFTAGFQDALKTFKLTGVIDEGFLDQIRSMGYEYGDALADLTELQFELYGAKLAVEVAEAVVKAKEDELELAEDLLETEQERLETAREYYEKSDVNVRKLVQEYNDLVRSGASKSVLLAKKEEIDAAMGERDIAKENIAIAEEKVKQAEDYVDQKRDELDDAQELLDIEKENLEIIQERVDAQEELLNQLLRLTEYEEEALETGKELGEALGDIELPDFGTMDFEIPDIAGELDKELADAERALRLQIKLMERNWLIFLAKMRIQWGATDWDAETQPLVDALNNLTTNAGELLDVLIKPGGLNEALLNLARNIIGIQLSEDNKYIWSDLFPGTTFTNPFSELEPEEDEFNVGEFMAGLLGVGYDDSYWQQKLAPFREGWNNFWAGEGDNFGDATAQGILNGISKFLFPGLTTVIDTLPRLMKPETWAEIKTEWDTFWTNFATTVSTKTAGIRTVLSTWIEDNKIKWNTFWDEAGTKVDTKWEEIKTWISTKSAEAATTIETWIADRKLGWDTFWSEASTTVETKWNEIKTWISTKSAEITTSIETWITERTSGWDTFWTGATTTVETEWGNIKTAIDTKVNEIGSKIQGFIDEKKPAWETFWGNLKTTVETTTTNIKTWIDTTFTEIGEFFTPIQTLVDNLCTAFDTLKTNIGNVIIKIGDFFRDLANRVLPDWVLDLFPGSPPPFSVGMKVNTKELDSFSKSFLKLPSIATPSSERFTPATTRNTTANNTFNFGNNNINNGMDAAMFETMLQRSLARALT